jgi:hypothetical protein
MNNDILNIEGYLFLKQTKRAQEQYSHFTREKKLTENALKSFSDNIYHNNKYCEDKGISYCHVVFPAKMIALNKLFSKKNITLFPLFNQRHELKNVYYPLQQMVPSEHYSKTDTHINDRGSAAILDFLLAKIGINCAEPQFGSTKQFGDLGIMINHPVEEVEKIISYNNLIPHVKHYSLSPALSGNTGDLDYYLNSNYISNNRVLLFGDSFFKNSISIYSYFFKEVIYIRNTFILTDLANILAPDIIFTGNAERYLVTPPNVNCFRPFFANFLTGNFNSKKLTRETQTAFHYLLLGRENPEFKRWLFNKRISIPKQKLYVKNLDKITESDVKTDTDVDFCRDTAVKFENISFEISRRLMRIAAVKRPDGEFIKQKLEEYKNNELGSSEI